MISQDAIVGMPFLMAHWSSFEPVRTFSRVQQVGKLQNEHQPQEQAASPLFSSNRHLATTLMNDELWINYKKYIPNYGLHDKHITKLPPLRKPDTMQHRILINRERLTGIQTKIHTRISSGHATA